MSSESAAHRTMPAAYFYNAPESARVASVPNIERRTLDRTELQALKDAHAPIVDFVPVSAEHPARAYKVRCLCGTFTTEARSLRVALDQHGAHIVGAETVVIRERVAHQQEKARRLAELDATVEAELFAGWEATAEADAALPRIGTVLRFPRP